MTAAIAQRVFEVARRGLDVAGLDPQRYGVRIAFARDAAQVSFTDAPSPGDDVVEDHGVRLYIDPSIASSEGATIGVSAEHDQIVVTFS